MSPFPEGENEVQISGHFVQGHPVGKRELQSNRMCLSTKRVLPHPHCTGWEKSGQARLPLTLTLAAPRAACLPS